MIGFKIVCNPILAQKKFIWFKKPKSKKKRIRKKFRRNKANWKWVIEETCVLWNNTIFVGPIAYEKLLKYDTKN